MATYGQLLVDAGGGIINRAMQSPQEPGATLIIGLGGTGSDAVMKLKKEVFKQLLPDDEQSTIPEYKSIRYLIIDSDDSKIKAQNGNLWDVTPNEFYSLSNDSIQQTFAATKNLAGRPELSWLDYENIHPNSAKAGAGGMRAVGRFLLVDKAEALYTKIKAQMNAALTNAEDGSLNVHICAGISGGTGSGTFIDICYLVKAALKEIGKPQANVCGYFFLPDVNLSIPAIANDAAASKMIKVNGYSALKELDYCMNFGKNKDCFEMNYGFKKITDNTLPVDLCYLVSTIDASGNVIKNGYKYAMGVVCDSILTFLAKVEMPPGVDSSSDSSGLTVMGHVSNLNQLKNQITVQNGGAIEYNIIGAAVAEVPLSEIATYLGSKLFEQYAEVFGKIPFDGDRDDFLVKSHMTYEDLRSDLTKGCVPQLQWSKQYDAKLYKETGNKRFVDKADEYYAHNIGELKKNFSTMTEELGEFDITAEGTSLVSRTFKNLFDHYVTNLEFGPYFAKRLLFGSNNANLIKAIDGMIAKNDEYLEAEVRQKTRRRDEIEAAESKMETAFFLNAGAACDNYKAALGNWYSHLYRVEVYKALGDMLVKFKNQLSALDNDFFVVLITILDTLSETFEKNAKILTEGVKNDNSYTWKILSISDIQENLDEVVKNVDVSMTLYNLMMAMFNNCKLWIGQDENKISTLVSSFVLTEFREATLKTMTDYLIDKYKERDLKRLAKKIEEDIIDGHLYSNSAPLFWKNSMHGGGVTEQNTLTVPYDSAQIKDAAEDFKESGRGGKMTVRKSHITDKLTVMRFLSGLPMHAYQGIAELEREYESNQSHGRHLYETGDKDWNKILPSPIPSSFDDSSIDRITKRNEALVAEFKLAEELGVIVEDNNRWFICESEGVDVSGLAAELEACADTKALKAFEDKVSGILGTIAQTTKKEELASLNANAGSERKVMLDFYLMSPVANARVKAEVEKRRVVSEMSAKIEEKYGSIKDKSLDLQNFCDAVFSGVISYDNRMVFSYDNHGIPKELVLQDMTMEPYGRTGAYQAFQTYKALDDKMKERIKESTMARLNSSAPELAETCKKCDDMLGRRIAGYLQAFEDDRNFDEIEEFFTDFMSKFESFKLSYLF